MTFRQFFALFLGWAISFTLLSCTSSGSHLSEDIYQEEEEEYERSKKGLLAEEDSEEGAEDLQNSEEDMSVGEEGSFDETTDIGDSTESLIEEADSYESSPVEVSETAAPKKTWVPLKKIPTSPWKHEGRWINTVYIAREGDTLKNISLTLFGNEDLQVDLRNANPFLKRRPPKVGDKIYYTSPKRSNDRERFLHYFEEKEELPLTYDIQAGQNIRTVSTELLGHVDSWKEIWATNPQLVSKGIVNEPTTIQYWAGKDNIEAPAPPSLADEPPEEMKTPPDEGVSENENMEMPETEENLLKEENLIKEPPTIGEIESPPSEEETQKIEEPQEKSDSNVLKIAVVAAIILIIAFLLVKIIRNRKNKDFDFSQTHIDIDNIEE